MEVFCSFIKSHAITIPSPVQDWDSGSHYNTYKSSTDALSTTRSALGVVDDNHDVITICHPISGH